jgi:hypothetical protein
MEVVNLTKIYYKHKYKYHNVQLLYVNKKVRFWVQNGKFQITKVL